MSFVCRWARWRRIGINLQAIDTELLLELARNSYEIVMGKYSKKTKTIIIDYETMKIIETQQTMQMSR